MKYQMDLSPIKEIPIVEVARRLGIQVKGTKAMCFMGHDKASPSLSFYLKKNTWKCFGACGKYGDGITLVMEIEHLDFKSAIEWFSRNFGVNVGCQSQSPRNPLYTRRTAFSLIKPITNIEQTQDSEFAADSELYEWFIAKCSAVSSSTALKYLDSHGISLETAHRFNLRELTRSEYALRSLINKWGEPRLYRSGIMRKNNGHPERLMWKSQALLIPFYENGIITYIQARMFTGDRKFINPNGIPKPMFNADILEKLPAGHSIHLCEGVPDAIALETQGLNSVGILGARSFRADWVDRFLKFRVVLLGDGDPAGANFTKDISNYFMQRGKAVKCMNLPIGKDVADVLAQSKEDK